MPPKFTGQRPAEAMGPRMITIITAQVRGVCAVAISVMIYMCSGNKRDDIHACAASVCFASYLAIDCEVICHTSKIKALNP